MIKPIQSGQALLDDIHNTGVQAGEVAIWWLGQSGYAIKTASSLFYIDLYLSEHLTTKYANTEKPHIRKTEAPLRGNDIVDARWIFASHKHSDHLDPGTLPALFQGSPDAKLILPAAIIDHAVGIGLPRDRLIGMRGDDTLNVGAIKVQAIPSAHPGLDFDPEAGYCFLGYVFEVDGVRIYHSGDTLVYPGLEKCLKGLAPDILFLPINGTDARREALQVPPNMNAAEAVALAKGVGAPLTVPHHYDMFTFNTVDVSEFTTRADKERIPYTVLRCGEQFVWKKG